MDYEKKYKEALEKARQLRAYPTTKPFIRDLQDIFPELAESEDERIRKGIIKSIMDLNTDWLELHGVTKEKALAWLEKKAEPKEHDVCDNCEQQGNCVSPCCVKLVEKNGEQKPVDKVEPKFKVGDIIRHKKQGFTCKIIAVDTEYRLSECNGTHLPFDWQDAYELVEQKPWSEEDENHVKSILSTIECCKAQFPNAQSVVEAYNADINWLKSLKDRYAWKPSGEQIKLLEDICGYNTIVTKEEMGVLESLLEELKKLTE